MELGAAQQLVLNALCAKTPISTSFYTRTIKSLVKLGLVEFDWQDLVYRPTHAAQAAYAEKMEKK